MKYIFSEWLIEAENKSDIQIINTSPAYVDSLLAPNGPFEQCFPNYMDKETLEFVKETTDWNASLKAVSSGQIVGFYLLGHKGVGNLNKTIKSEKARLEKGENLKKYKGLTGIEGVALGVIPEYRGRKDFNVAKELKNRVRETEGIHYIYGMQYKSLGNLNNWIGTPEKPKARRLFAQSHDDDSENPVYITLEDLPKKLN